MARLDRRRNYPLFDKNDVSTTGIFTDLVTYAAMVPTRVGGVIKIVGGGYVNGKFYSGSLPMNRIAGVLRNPYLYKVAGGKMNKGGVSRFFGSRR
jgi:hypothetical protein